MSPRNSVLLALAVLILLGAYVFFFEREPSGPEAPQPVTILSIDTDQLQAVEIAQRDGSSFRLERVAAAAPAGASSSEAGAEGGASSEEGAASDGAASEGGAAEWRMTSPVDWEVAEIRLNSLLTRLRGLQARSTLASGDAASEDAALGEGEGGGTLESLDAYGLEPPNTTVTLTLTDGERRLYIGSPTPVAGSYYAQVDGSEEIYTISASDALPFLSGADAYREREILAVALQDVTEAKITNAEGTSHLVKEGDRWRLQDPWNDWATTETVTEALNPFMYLNALEFVDNPTDLSQYGLDEPRAVLSLSANTASGPVKRTIYVGKAGDQEGTVWIKADGRDTLYLVSVGEITVHEQGPFDLFLKDLVPTYDLLNVTGFDLSGDDIEFAVRKINTSESGGTGFVWKVGDLTVPPRTMTDLLTKLIEVDITEVGDVVADPARVPYDHFTITVYKTAQDGTQSTSLIRFSAPEGGMLTAVSSDRPRLYKVPVASLDALVEFAQNVLKEIESSEETESSASGS